jgi:imidazolonepropionase-like amidohydrolase
MAFAGMVSAQAESVVIHCGRLIDVEALEILSEQSIVVNANLIEAIEPGYRESTGAIDLKESTCMPGLMDMHVHMLNEYNPRRRVERLTLHSADYAIRGVVHARTTLASGFTLVRDLGADRQTIVALRNAINKGLVPGPRIYAATKSIATTGGHADPTNSLRHDLMGDPGPVDGVINGPDEARQAVRQRYKDGADVVKITATGGVLSVAKSGQNAQFQQLELEAIIDTAKDYGMHVAAHAHGTEGMRRAVEAGVHSIEHGTFMTADVMKLMKRKGTWYVPTIIAGRWVAEKSETDGFFPELVRPKAAAIGPKIQGTFANAYKAGVKIAFGTDSGVSPHGDNALEFTYMVEAGMPPLETIQSATLRGAELMGMEDILGTLEPGKLADIIAVPGNPVDDIGLMMKVNFVMKNGEVYKK